MTYINEIAYMNQSNSYMPALPLMKLSIIEIFFRVFSVLTMAQFFLPIVFENLFFPLDRKYFYFLGWITALLFFYPQIFHRSRFLFIYFFAAWYILFIYLGIYNVELEWIRGELESVFFAVMMLQYFMNSRDYKWLTILILLSFCFFAITLSTTLIGLQTHPLAVRCMANGVFALEKPDIVLYYRKIGIVGYDFFYGLAFTMPALIVILKTIKKQNLKRMLWFFIGFSLYGILKSQLTTAFLFAVIGTGIAFWSDEKIESIFLKLFVLILFVIFFPNELVGDAVNSFARLLDEGTIRKRLIDLSISLKQGVGKGHTHIDLRYNRILLDVNYFVRFASIILSGFPKMLRQEINHF